MITMNFSSKSFAAFSLLALGAGYALSAATTASATSAPVVSTGLIEGSWSASINFGGAVSLAMYSFHADGTLTEADNPGFDPNFNGDALSPGIGSWEGTSSTGIGARARYQKFAYGTDGTLNLIYTSTMQVRNATEDVLAGTLDLSIALPDGTVVNTIPGLTFTAERITPF